MAPSTGTPVILRIDADRLPGRRFGAAPGFPGYEDVHVAVQSRGRPARLLGLTPGDAAAADWSLDCTARTAVEGTTELTGPYVHGGPGDRFVYLTWGEAGPEGAFTMFRRAKLMLNAVEPDVLAAAVRSGRLTGRLGLSDPEGRPLCARVVPPAVAWSA